MRILMATMAQKPSQEWVDEHMSKNIADILFTDFASNHNGHIPSNSELTAYINTIQPNAQLELIRGKSALNSVEMHLRDSSDILRWIKIVCDRPA